MNCLTRFVLHAYMAYVFLPESYVSKYILIRLEDFTIEHPVDSPNHEDLDYPEPQEKMQVLSKDGKHINNVNGRRLNQQNIKSSFRMILKALSRSSDGTYYLNKNVNTFNILYCASWYNVLNFGRIVFKISFKKVPRGVHQWVCKTEGGYRCKFPFTYKGKTYNGCTKAGGYRRWCYQIDGRWDYCKTGQCNGNNMAINLAWP